MAAVEAVRVTAQVRNGTWAGMLGDTMRANREAFQRRRCVVPADGFFEWTGPKEDRQRMHGHQERRVTRATEAPIGRQPNRWNQIVDMRMVTQIARPGLEYAQHAELPANKARIGSQLLQRRSRGAKEQAVDLSLVAVRQCA